VRRSQERRIRVGSGRRELRGGHLIAFIEFSV
jgi:hypothetical protein